MAKAFQCDYCKTLQAGTAKARITFEHPDEMLGMHDFGNNIARKIRLENADVCSTCVSRLFSTIGELINPPREG